MTSKAAVATEAAHRIWERASNNGASDEAATAERLCAQLQTGLRRWIGNDGYRALLDRALGSVRPEHPALDDVPSLRGDAPTTTATVRAHDATKVPAGMVALVAVVIELLGRIIGEEMAVRFVEQIGTASPRGTVSTKTEGERDG
jgi:hypothetical protein